MSKSIISDHPTVKVLSHQSRGLVVLIVIVTAYATVTMPPWCSAASRNIEAVPSLPK